MFVLDTDIVTLLSHGEPTVCERATDQNHEDLSVTIITVEEMLSGWYSEVRRSKKDEKIIRAYQALQEAVEFFGRIRILPFDKNACRTFRELKRSKSRVGTNDLKIAAIVIQNEATLVSRNVRDFERLPNIRCEDWSR